MTKLKFVAPLLFLGILVLVGAGCGGNGDTSVVIPKLDVAGQDIQDVPRYPGSVRVYSAPMYGIPDAVTVVYVTSASIDTVADFYEAQLPANGWESELTAEIMEELGLTCRMYVGQTVMKENWEVFVLVGDSSDYSGYTEANISFRELTEQEH